MIVFGGWTGLWPHTPVIPRGPSCSLHRQSPSHPGGEILHISDPRDHTTCGLFGLAVFTECHLPGRPTLWWLPRSSACCGCTTVPVRLLHVPSTAHLRMNIWVVLALPTVNGATGNMRGQVSRGHVLSMLLGRHLGVARCHGAVPPAFSRMFPKQPHCLHSHGQCRGTLVSSRAHLPHVTPTLVTSWSKPFTVRTDYDPARGCSQQPTHSVVPGGPSESWLESLGGFPAFSLAPTLPCQIPKGASMTCSCPMCCPCGATVTAGTGIVPGAPVRPSSPRPTGPQLCSWPRFPHLERGGKQLTPQRLV